MVFLCPAESHMLKCLFAAIALFVGLYGCAATEETASQQLGETYSSNPPTIDSVFAAETISPRNVWRVYINASDPDGDIRAIQAWAEVPWHSTPTRFNVDADQRQSLSGYIEFDTVWFLNFAPIWIRMQVTIEDRLNNRSELVEHQASFSAGVKPELPPQGVYQERSLGRVPVETFPPAF